MAKLYVVATPIGNLEDITLRALKVLGDVGLIAAEDTRHTRKLLSRYGISTRTTSYHEHNEREKAPRLIERIKQGTDVALVTDAGTPGISDPGYRLVRLAHEESVEVETVPGPSALTAVLAVSGLPTDEFTFKGFIPSAPLRRRRFLAALKGCATTYIMYESPRRLKGTLGDILEILGDVEIVVAREMTKLHEEILRGRTSDVAERLRDREVKGEITIVLRTGKVEAGSEAVDEKLKALLDAGVPVRDAVREVAAELGVPRNVVYRKALELKGA